MLLRQTLGLQPRWTPALGPSRAAAWPGLAVGVPEPPRWCPAVWVGHGPSVLCVPCSHQGLREDAFLAWCPPSGRPASLGPA